MLLGIQLKYWQEIIITIYDFNSNLKKNKKNKQNTIKFHHVKNQF